MLLESFTGFRNSKGRLVKSACIVRSEIHYNSIRFPGSKIIVLLCTDSFINLSQTQTTDFFVAGWDIMTHIIVPSTINSPAALRNQTVIRIKSFCSISRIILAAAHIHGKPVGIGNGTVSTLARGNAVPDEFDFIFKFLHWKKFTITSKASDEYMTVIVLTHGLKFADKFHGFRNTKGHVAEKTDRITTRKKHLTAHKSPV